MDKASFFLGVRGRGSFHGLRRLHWGIAKLSISPGGSTHLLYQYFFTSIYLLLELCSCCIITIPTYCVHSIFVVAN